MIILYRGLIFLSNGFRGDHVCCVEFMISSISKHVFTKCIPASQVFLDVFVCFMYLVCVSGMYLVSPSRYLRRWMFSFLRTISIGRYKANYIQGPSQVTRLFYTPRLEIIGNSTTVWPKVKVVSKRLREQVYSRERNVKLFIFTCHLIQ